MQLASAKTRSVKTLLNCLCLFVLAAFVLPAGAACVRYKAPAASANHPPVMDGPGSFGELHETVTLDCLAYVGSIKQGKEERVLIRDEQGILHTLKLGSYVGENSGIIKEIHVDFIDIHQLVKRDGQWVELSVKLPRAPDPKPR
ncbi:MAG TPA: pilus assembly protein PilP [Burkholderiales bacterium]|nr:pilus assembly protein PilP [Burkholderiales bacterium]